jgi:hypothetical protein
VNLFRRAELKLSVWKPKEGNTGDAKSGGRAIVAEISIWEHCSYVFLREQKSLCRNIVPRNTYVRIQIPGTTSATRAMHEQHMAMSPSFVDERP